MLGSHCRSGNGKELFSHSSSWRSWASVALSHHKYIWDICLPLNKSFYWAGGDYILPYDPIMSFSYWSFGLVVYFSYSFLGDADPSILVEQLMHGAAVVVCCPVISKHWVIFIIVSQRLVEGSHSLNQIQVNGPPSFKYTVTCDSKPNLKYQLLSSG